MKNIYSSATKLTLLLLVLALIVFTGMQIEIGEPFRTVVLMVVAFYFGQKTNVQSNETNTA